MALMGARRDVVRLGAATGAVVIGGLIATRLFGDGAGVVLTVGVATALLAFWSLALSRRLEHRAEDTRIQLEATVALYHAVAPVLPLPGMHGYALAPDSALLLFNLVRELAPNVVVETGSGLSTLLIGYALKEQGHGKLLSLDMNAQFAARTRALVERHGLSSLVTVVHAPLGELSLKGTAYRWHDAAALEGVSHIDLVFDDGPPSYAGPRGRAASLPVFEPKLSEKGCLLMNFIGVEERQTVEQWLKAYPNFEAQRFDTRKGNVLLRRR